MKFKHWWTVCGQMAFLLMTIHIFIDFAKAEEDDAGFVSEVNGVYTNAGTKDLGAVTKIKDLEGVKARGWVSTYLNENLNGNAIGGRNFDIRNRSFTLELAEVEIEKTPETGGVGFKVDLAFGDTQDQIFSSIKASHGNGSLSESDRYIQHASVSYVAPIGRGLRFDLGKFVTHMGGESIEGIKNANASRSYYFVYGIPYQDTGLRVNYGWSDSLYTELYFLNGWNTTIDNDDKKAIGLTIGLSHGPFGATLNYLGGDESDTRTTPIGARSTMRTLLDGQIYYNGGRLNLGANLDFGNQKDVPDTAKVGNTIKVTWSGYTFYARYRVSESFEPALRYEYYKDDDKFTVGTAATSFQSLTATANYRLGRGAGHILLRPEVRYDKADVRVAIFKDKLGNEKDHQTTLGLNAVYYF